MAGIFGTSAYGANPYMRFSALMGGNPFDPYGNNQDEDPRLTAMRSLQQRNAGALAQGHPINWDPITQPSRGRLAGGGYGGNVPDPTYGNLGLGSVGVQTPRQYLAPGRRNPFYGPYISGGRVNPGQMTNFVAGRLQPGQGGAPNPFGGNSVASVQDDGTSGGQTPRQAAILAAFRAKNRINPDSPRFPGVMQDPDRGIQNQTHQIDPELGQKLFQQGKQRREDAMARSSAFRQTRAQQQAMMGSQPDPNAAMQFAASSMMHPMMPGAAQHNAAVMHMASQMHAANMQGASQNRMFGLQQQQLQHQMQQAQQQHAFRQQQLAQQGQLGAAQLGLQFQQQNPGANVNQFMGGLGNPFGPQGPGANPTGNPAGQTQGMFPQQVFDPSKMHDVMGATADMPDAAAYQHATGLGMHSSHLDQYIAQNMNPSSWFEGSIDKALRLRRLAQARRLRGMFPNPPANPNAPLAPPGQQPQPDPMAGMFPSNPGF